MNRIKFEFKAIFLSIISKLLFLFSYCFNNLALFNSNSLAHNLKTQYSLVSF